MRNSTWNNLVTWGGFGFVMCFLGFLVWALFSAGLGRRAWVLAAVAVGTGIWTAWTIVRTDRLVKSVERDLENAGVDVPEEERIELKFIDRKSGAASILALLVIAFVFVAYWFGWLADWGLTHLKPT